MSILAGVGFSQNPNPESAINEAYNLAIEPLGNHKPTCILLFASSTAYDQQRLLSEIHSKVDTTVIGCSTAGEITSAGGSLDDSVAMMLLYSDTMQFTTGVGHDLNINTRNAGKSLALDMQNRGGKPKAALILPDGLSGNGADIVRGVQDIFGHDFLLVGGSAGDDFHFKRTYQYFGNEVFSNSVVGVGFSGSFSYGIGVRHGWIPIGAPHIATKSKDNVLYELDGKPAIDIYESNFGKEKFFTDNQEPFAQMAITYPLGIPSPGRDGFLIRDALRVDEAGAITCAAEIPQGSVVYLMIGSREESIDAAEDAARSALAKLNGKKPKAIVLFNCIARKKLLMSKKHIEIEKMRTILGADVPLIGFYTYGEQAPLGEQVLTCSFHNETDVIFLLAE